MLALQQTSLKGWERIAAGTILFVPAVGWSLGFSESFRYPKLWMGEGLVVLAWLGSLLARPDRPVPEGLPGRKPQGAWSDQIWDLTVVAAAISLINCSHWLTGGSELMRLLSLALAFALFRRVCEPWRLLPLILFAGVLNAALACLQAGGWAPEWGIRQDRHAIYGTFGNPNFLGEYLAPVVILAIGWSLREAERMRPWLAGGAVLGLLSAALLLTVSRAAWLGLVVGGTVFLLVALPALRASWCRKKLLMIFTAPLLVTLVLWRPLIVRITSSFDTAGDPGVVTRVFMWKTAVAQFKDHPWLGAGPGGYNLNYLEYAARLQEAGEARPAYAGITQEAHNEPLQLLAERGLIGALAWLAAFVFIMRPAVRGWRDLSPADRIRRASAAGAVVAILVECLFGFPMRIFPVAVLFLWALVCVTLPRPVCGGGPADDLPLAGKTVSWVRGARAIVLCLPCLWLLGRTLVADRALALGGTKSGGEAHLRAGLKLLPSHGELRFRLGLKLRRQGRLAEATEEFQAALAGFKDPDVHFNLGIIALQQQRFADAVTWFEAGLRQYPYFNARAYADLAESLWGAGRPDAARSAARRALQIDPGLSRIRDFVSIRDVP